MTAECQEEVASIVKLLRDKTENHEEEASSIFSSSTLHLAKAEAYTHAADMLEDRILKD